MGDQIVKAAGCVAFKRQGRNILVLVAHRPKYDDWSFPKGKLDENETEFEAALRETEEETGAIGTTIGELAPVEYSLVDSRIKTVRYWVMQYERGEFVSNSEVDAVRWVSPSEAKELLSYAHDKLLLDEFRDRFL